jgi:hypothetical protein
MMALVHIVMASEARQSSSTFGSLDCRASAKRKFILSACKAVEGLAMTNLATEMPSSAEPFQ